MITNTNNVMSFQPDKIIGKNYVPAPYYGSYWWTDRKPMFSLRWVRYMLDDSRIVYGLGLAKAPVLTNMKVEVHCDDKDAAEFIRKTLDRFWTFWAHIPLTAIDWGFSTSEVLYTLRKGKYEFVGLKPFHPYDVRVLTQDGRKVGHVIRRVYGITHYGQNADVMGNSGRQYVWNPKSFWHVHKPEHHPWYGQSQLKYAYPHWFDKFRDGGSTDALSLFFYKYALKGERIYYPPHAMKGRDGQIVDPEAKARSLANDTRSGATLCIPNDRDSNGYRLWEIEDSKNPATGTELIDYHALLDAYIFQALEIPSELVEAGSSGSGYAGRRVPAQTFYQTRQTIGNRLVLDFQEQIMDYLMMANYGHDDYELIPESLLGDDEQQTGEEGDPGEQSSSDPGGGMSTKTLRGATGSAVVAPREEPNQ